jgi:predicted alpha/beta superfamily hydrolase
MNNRRLIRNALALLGLLLCAAPFAARGQVDGSPIVCGVHRILFSKVLNEERPLLISLPKGYDKSDKQYPVLYKLDGDLGNFLQAYSAAYYLYDWIDKAPEVIIVGIENTKGNRGRDLEPENGADNFLQFIKAELIPFIETNYRANGFRSVGGQSSSSCFALYSFLKEPSLFDAYLLSSFGLYNESRAALFEKDLNANPDLKQVGKKYIYIANGKRDSYDPDSTRAKRGEQFLESLKKVVPDAVQVKYQMYEDEGHVPFPAIYAGLKWIYSQEKAAGK